jgi:hypothetical protein
MPTAHIKIGSSLVISLFCALLYCQACKKTTAVDHYYPGLPHNVHAKVNGSLFNQREDWGGGSHSFLVDGAIQIIAYDSFSNGLELRLKNCTTTGTIDIATGLDTIFYSSNNNNDIARSGYVTIVAVNGYYVAGTFNFVTSTDTVTDGTFNININQ